MAIKISGTTIVDDSQRLRITGVSTLTTGPILVGTATSTGTASQPLQVTGGAYVSGALGVGYTAPGFTLAVNGSGYFNTTLVGSTILAATQTQTGTASQPLQVAGGGYFSGSVGIGSTNPSSTLSVGGTITELYAGQYWNLVSQADIGIGASQVPLNQYLGQLAFLDSYSPSGLRRDGGGADDVIINSSGFVGIGTTNPVGQLQVSFGPIIVGTSSSTGTASQPLQVTGGAYVSGNLGIGSTSPTSKLDVVGDIKVSGVVTATAFVGSGANLTNLPASLNLAGVSTLGFFGDDQNITSSLTLPSNTKLYTVHKNINVATGSTFTVGSSSTVIMDRFNNLDDVVATSFKGDGSQLTGIPVGDLYELDSISPAGGENTYTPTFNYDTVSVTDPFRLLISVNGIMQSAYVHNTEYVHNNYLLASRTGYTIDYDGKIKFTESLPEGSEVVIKTIAGTTKSTTRKYPFNALDILF